MSVQIIRGDALALPLPDGCVDLVVTSPPYFGLRSYQDDGEHYAGQLGSEATPAEFVDALIAATREMVRVLKPAGSIWVNLGDKYSQSAAQWGGSRRGHQGILAGTSADEATQFGVALAAGAPAMGRPKSLIGIPWRYALRCIDDLGLILRAEVIWSKPNGLPESVTDRVRRSHESWFHMTKEPRYFSAVDEIREAHVKANFGRLSEGRAFESERTTDRLGVNAAHMDGNPLGKLPGSVWTIPTQPLTVPAHLGVDHFAAFPMEWPRRIIAGWSPAGVCTGCGEGRRPVVDVQLRGGTPFAGRDYRRLANGPNGGPERPMPGGSNEVTIAGYTCACPDTTAPTTPARILDPFGGTGTTALVAHVNGRHGISVDYSADYCRLARWRTTDPNQLAAAALVDKPPVECVGQESLFDLEATR